MCGRQPYERVTMKFLDFFAGIGGFRLGMEMAGHECLGHCEIDKYANISYAAMHNPKEGEWFADNIRDVQPGDLPEADVYCFGFPCQAFSIAGNRGGFEDTRGTLFFEVMRLAAVRKPKYLFAENVAGLLSHDGGRTFGTIISTLGELGYWWEYQVLNSKDFGVPQNRERVFIIGHLGRRSGGEVFPIGSSNGTADGIQGQCANTITARYGQAYGQGNYVSESEQYAQKIKQISGGSQSERIYAAEGLSPCLDTMQGGNKMPKVAVPVLTPDRPEKRQNGRRFKEDGDPMFTLTAQDKHGVAVYQKTFGGTVTKKFDETGTLQSARLDKTPCIESGLRIRKLTPRECFRLQGFPDTYFERAAAVNSNSQLYKQAGNSVTVNVIYEIAKRLEC
jgi:DNA (cytosine-5)-methyltransferase 1